MRHPLPLATAFVSSLIFAVAAAALAAAPAPAQTSTVEELVVTAPNAPPERKQLFSYKLGYADLDLKTETGKASLRHRIRVTAEYVCHRLAATDNKPNTFGDCRRKAIDGAQAQAGKAITAAEARTGPFQPGPRWQPPPGAN